MSTTHLGRAVNFICSHRGTTQTQIATNAGLSQVILSRACAGTRPEAKTLRALCTSQPEPRDNLDLLVGYLRDEIERAGHSTHEIDIRADSSRLDDDLRVLLDEARTDEQLAGMLRQLASFVRTHPLATEEERPTLMVAEDQAPYGTNPDPAEAPDPLKEALRRRAAEGTRRPPSAPDKTPPGAAKGTP